MVNLISMNCNGGSTRLYRPGTGCLPGKGNPSTKRDKKKWHVPELPDGELLFQILSAWIFLSSLVLSICSHHQNAPLHLILKASLAGNKSFHSQATSQHIWKPMKKDQRWSECQPPTPPTECKEVFFRWNIIFQIFFWWLFLYKVG